MVSQEDLPLPKTRAHAFWPSAQSPSRTGSGKVPNVTFGLHSYADTLDCIISPHSFLTLKPVYDMIWRLPVYDMIWRLPVYDMIWRLSWIRCDLATRLGTISISEPHILRYLVVGELRSLST